MIKYAVLFQKPNKKESCNTLITVGERMVLNHEI